MYGTPAPIRKTILLELDVMVADENEDYLEVEITHPRLSGAMYLTVNSRKELEEEFAKIDITGTDDIPREERPYTPPVIFMGNSSSEPKPALAHQLPVPDSAAPVESLIKNTYNLASGLMQLRATLGKKK